MAQLTEVPEGRELEDFVAALLQSTRHFVEKNVEEHHVLELDVVSTSYASGAPSSRLFEVKGKEPGFTDVFKLFGWMNYLGIAQGAYVVRQPPKDNPPEFYASRCDEMNIKLLVIDHLDAARDTFKEAGFGEADELRHIIWRFSFWIERCLIRVLRDAAARDPNFKAPREALDYYKLVNNGVFFTKDVRQRVRKLYDAYMNHPKLTLGAAREIAGQGFDPVTPGKVATLGDAFLKGEHPILHACMYVEHRARLSLLKAAIDCICEEGGEAPAVVTGSGQDLTIDFGLASLPQNFHRAMQRIADQDHFWLYPLFWQVFLWGWGGFILPQREADELQGLSEHTGLPIEAIPTALEVFDWLFPTEGTWLHQMPSASYRFIKMVPWAFQGLGGFHRLKRYDLEGYQKLHVWGDHTAEDLNARHNATVKLLDELGPQAR